MPTARQFNAFCNAMIEYHTGQQATAALKANKYWTEPGASIWNTPFDDDIFYRWSEIRKWRALRADIPMKAWQYHGSPPWK